MPKKKSVSPSSSYAETEVLISVAIDSSGHWHACGSSEDKSNKDSVSVVKETLDRKFKPEIMEIKFIKAKIRLPFKKIVSGTEV